MNHDRAIEGRPIDGGNESPDWPVVEPVPTLRDHLASLASYLISARRVRLRYLPEKLGDGPAWEILLILFSEGRNCACSVTDVGLMSGLSMTTALRWLGALERQDIVTRENDPSDGRRAFVKLTPLGDHLMWTCLRECSNLQPPARR